MNNIASISVAPRSLASEVLKVIDQGGVQLALVLDSNKRLLGTLTDGDIRRGLLYGQGLDSPAEKLMNRNFRFIRNFEDQSLALEIMRRDLLHQMPVLDKQGRVLEILLLEDLLAPSHLPYAVVVMAGGKGTRLRPQTEKCPKPMLPVGEKPILEIVLEQCISSGFKRFFLSVNYLKEQIFKHFESGEQWGVSIDYLEEDKPLGTAGSLQLLPDCLTEPFLVLNGDVLTRFNPRQLISFHIEHQAKATVCVREHEISVPFGVVQTKGVEMAGFEEKPTYRHLVNAGVYVIDPELLPLLPHHQATDMPSLLMKALEVGMKVVVCPIHEYWIDVGRQETLSQAHREWPAQQNL